MIFLGDLGNSEIRCAIADNSFSGEREKLYLDVFLSSHKKTSHEILAVLLSLMDLKGINKKMLEGAVISSVVPSLTSSFEDAVSQLTGERPMVVGPGIKTGLNIRTDNPRELGSDRIVNAVAAYSGFKKSLIIIDFGNATTFCHMDSGGIYRGGTILPGMIPSTESLFSSCEKLPVTDAEKSQKILGKNTPDSVRSGLYHGYRIMTEGMIREIKKEIKDESGEDPFVIATGRGVPEEASLWEGIDVFDSLLTLKGLKLIYDKNR